LLQGRSKAKEIKQENGFSAKLIQRVPKVLQQDNTEDETQSV